MKNLIIALSMIATLGSVQAAEVSASQVKLKQCLTSVYTKAGTSNATVKDLTKFVSEGTKACRASVKEMVAKERAEKKKTRIEAQIAKLQAKLKG